MQKIDLSKFNGYKSRRSGLIWTILDENKLGYKDVLIDISRGSFRVYTNVEFSFFKKGAANYNSFEDKDSIFNCLRINEAEWNVIRVEVNKNFLFIDGCLCEIYVK